MKRTLVAALAAVLLLMPAIAEAQQKKNNQPNEPNPLVFIAGILSAVNCIITCGGTTTTVVRTIFIPQNEGPPLASTSSSSSRVYGAYLGGAMACTFLWPFINVAVGGKEPTSEEALAITASCWVPGLGIVLYLSGQYTP